MAKPKKVNDDEGIPTPEPIDWDSMTPPKIDKKGQAILDRAVQPETETE